MVRFVFETYPAYAQRYIAFLYDKIVNFVAVAKFFQVSRVTLDFTGCHFEEVFGVEVLDLVEVSLDKVKMLPHSLIASLLSVSLTVA